MNSMLEKGIRVLGAALLVFGLCAVPAIAQDGADGATAAVVVDNTWMGGDKAFVAIGAGLVIIGAGVGIGMLASSAVAGIARQPDAGGDIRTTMIIAAALIEGATLFALIICILTLG